MTDTTDVPLFGFCPKCGARGYTRERRPNGNDQCERGHRYPSASARSHSTTGNTTDAIRQEFTTLDALLYELSSAIMCREDPDSAIADIRNRVLTIRAERDAACVEIARLRAALEDATQVADYERGVAAQAVQAMKVDAARLDWLDTKAHDAAIDIYPNFADGVALSASIDGVGKTLRDAIDDAMARGEG